MPFLPRIPLISIGLCLIWSVSNAADLKSAHDTIDELHLSAAKADAKKYFNLFTMDAVFLGTDATERWTISAFRKFATPYFDAGKGWKYVSRDRHINISADGRHASFDELLDNSAYGLCRGTGVLRLVDGVWKIEQYHLTIPLPNEIARDVVDQIRKIAK